MSAKFLTLDRATKREEYLNHMHDCDDSGSNIDTMTFGIVLPCAKWTVTVKLSSIGNSEYTLAHEICLLAVCSIGNLLVHRWWTD